jgi:hypothetical protein
VAVDKRNKLAERPFSYRATQDGRVLLYAHGSHVKTLAAKQAERFLREIQGLEPRDQQLLLSKATGHYKHGNERRGKSSR